MTRRARRSIPTAYDPGSVIDLWMAGPGADGRGLDALNGGHAPLPGLQIVSPTADPGPSGQMRILIRDADDRWRPKAAGVLACIGKRVWTGDGWTYAGATDPTSLNPLPPLSLSGVTDSIRRFTTSGSVSVADVVGLLQPYAQRVTVAAGDNGFGVAMSVAETFTDLTSGEQVFWHLLLEPLAGVYELTWTGFGLWSDGRFVAGPVWARLQSKEVDGRAGRVVDRGVGPNGGRLFEVWASIVWSGPTLPSVQAQTRLFSTIDIHPGRSYVVHNLAAYRLPSVVGRWWDMPTFVLVAAGATPSLARESISFRFPGTGPAGGWESRGRRVTFAAQLDTTGFPLDWPGARVLRSEEAEGLAVLSLTGDTFGVTSPATSLGPVTEGRQTLWVALDDAGFVQAYRDGQAVGSVALSGLPAQPERWVIGGTDSEPRAMFGVLRRLLGWRERREPRKVASDAPRIAAQSGAPRIVQESGRGPAPRGSWTDDAPWPSGWGSRPSPIGFCHGIGQPFNIATDSNGNITWYPLRDYNNWLGIPATIVKVWAGSAPTWDDIAGGAGSSDATWGGQLGGGNNLTAAFDPNKWPVHSPFVAALNGVAESHGNYGRNYNWSRPQIWQEIARGDYDIYYQRCFRRLAYRCGLTGRDPRTVVIRWCWEANGNWYPHSIGPDKANFVVAWRRVMDIMRQAVGSVLGQGKSFMIEFGPTHTLRFGNGAYGANQPNIESLVNIYPGDDWVDICGTGIHDGIGITTQQDWDKHLDTPVYLKGEYFEGWRTWFDFAVSRNKWVGTSEVVSNYIPRTYFPKTQNMTAMWPNGMGPLSRRYGRAYIYEIYLWNSTSALNRPDNWGEPYRQLFMLRNS